MRGEQIVILRPTPGVGVDEQGAPVAGPDEEIDSDGWAIAPVTAAESSEPFAQQVIVGYSLYKRNVIEDVRPSDRIEIRGTVWAVTGQTGDWESPYSRFQGTVINVKAVG